MTRSILVLAGTACLPACFYIPESTVTGRVGSGDSATTADTATDTDTDSDTDSDTDTESDTDTDGDSGSDTAGLLKFYADTDSDGCGDPNSFRYAAFAPPGWVDNDYDCNDGTASIPMWASNAGSSRASGRKTDPYLTIKAALAAAAAVETTTRCVRVVGGTYTENLVAPSVDMEIVGVDGAGATIVDAAGSGSVLTMAGGTMAITGLTLSDGGGYATAYTVGAATVDQYVGGGVRQTGGNLTLTATVISGNKLPDEKAATTDIHGTISYGGGISFAGTSLTLDDVTFSGNNAYEGSVIDAGGGIIRFDHVHASGDTGGYGVAGVFVGGTVSITHSLIADEVGSTTDGFYMRGVAATFASSTLANLDQAITLEEGTNPPSTLTIDSSIITATDYAVVGDAIAVSTARLTYSDVTAAVPYLGISPVTDITDISKDPKFTGTSDYHLKSSSPCSNAGNPTAGNDDDGTATDMGRYGGAGGSTE